MASRREAYGDFQTTGPVIFSRNTTDDGWVGFANQVLWWNGSKWVYWLSTDPQFQSKPSNIFEQAFEERDRLDPRIGQTTDGSWNYHAAKGISEAVGRRSLTWLSRWTRSTRVAYAPSTVASPWRSASSRLSHKQV